MDTRYLGDTGLRVSSLSLGAMGFGANAQSPLGPVDVDLATRMLAMSVDAGVNLIDTANSYTGGRSEEVVGEIIGPYRDRVMISTKLHARFGEGANDVGQSRWNIDRSCERSLRKLRTDCIDILHVHGFDGCTPLEESLGALDRLVRAGKVRYLACSNYTAWQIAHALGISARKGLDRYVAVQAYYSLVARELEWDIVPACRELGVGIFVWSPLAGGLLSGKFRRDETPAGTRRAMIGDLGVGPVDPEDGWRIIDACTDVATQRGCSVAQVALNWVRANPAVTSVIIGARTTDQLADNLAAGTWELTADERAALDAASAVPLPYPHWFQRQFTAERFGPDGPPDPTSAHTYAPAPRGTHAE
jgi:aryl-alcohol dehydrogenase-like predicted oxidoreductase